jgi:hypothetical protein
VQSADDDVRDKQSTNNIERNFIECMPDYGGGRGAAGGAAFSWKQKKSLHERKKSSAELSRASLVLHLNDNQGPKTYTYVMPACVILFAQLLLTFAAPVRPSAWSAYAVAAPHDM